MSDFNSSVKYLDITKSRQATIDEATNNTKPFDKYYKLQRSRDIKKISTRLILPPFFYNAPLPLATGVKPILIFQYNVAFSQPFYILNYTYNRLITSTRNIQMFVKYRSGGIAYRYKLNIGLADPLGKANGTYVPVYSNQLLQKNVVFEVWSNTPAFIESFTGLKDPIYITTSLISNPTDVNQTSIDINAAAPVTATDMAIPFPMFVPTDNSVNAFLDN